MDYNDAMNNGHIKTHSKKPKILIGLFRVPYPVTDGTRKKILENVIQGLAQKYQLEFFITTHEPVTQESIDYLLHNYGAVHVFHNSLIQRIKNIIRAIFSGKPIQSLFFMNKKAYHWLQNNQDHFDALYFHEIRMTEYVVNASDHILKKTIIDLNDAISLNYKKALPFISWYKKWFYIWEGVRVNCYEQMILEKFFHSVVVAPRDREYLLAEQSNHKASVDVIPLGFDSQIPKVSLAHANNKIFFLGNLDYLPNQDAVVYLIEYIIPEVRLRTPNITCYIIGRAGAWADKYKKIPNVVFTGFVDCIDDYVNDCSAMVAPIRFGAGTPSKILDSMNRGIPVITTPNAIEGMYQSSDYPGMSIDEQDSIAWADAIVELCSDQKKREDLSDRGKLFIQNNYDTRMVQEKWVLFFDRIITSRNT